MRSYDDKAAALEYSESHVPSFILEEVVVGETAVTPSGWVKGQADRREGEDYNDSYCLGEEKHQLAQSHC